MAEAAGTETPEKLISPHSPIRCQPFHKSPAFSNLEALKTPVALRVISEAAIFALTACEAPRHSDVNRFSSLLFSATWEQRFAWPRPSISPGRSRRRGLSSDALAPTRRENQ